MATVNKTAKDFINVSGDGTNLGSLKTYLSSNNAVALYHNTTTKRLYWCDGTSDGVLLGSEVQKVDITDAGKLTITDYTGTAKEYDLSIDGALDALKTTIQGDYNAKFTTVNTTITNLATTVSGKVASVTGNLVRYVTPAGGTPDATQPIIDFFSEYDSTKNKINFYQGTSNSGTLLCSIDTTDFVYKGMIDEVSFDKNTKILTIDFNTNAGKADIEIDMSSLVDTYKAGDGLELANDGTFSLKLGEGLKINDAKNLAIDTDWLTSKLGDYGVASLGGKKGKISLGVSTDYYFGNSSSPENGVELPYNSVVLSTKDVSGNNAATASLMAAANPNNLLANLAYLIKNHPSLVTNLAMKGVNIDIDTNDSATYDFSPKLYTIS